MKHLLLPVLFMLCSMGLSAQSFEELKEIELASAEDYKQAEGHVKAASNYMLSQPITDENRQQRLYAINFIMRWMEGTPDYKFNLGKNFSDYCGNNIDLSSLYLSAMAKTAVENPVLAKNEEEIITRAEAVFLNYCAQKENKAPRNRAIKKALKNR